MKKFKAIICVALAALFAVSCFAGCTEKEELDIKKITLTDEQLSDVESGINEIIDSEPFYGGVSVMLNENEVYKSYFGKINKKGDSVTEDYQYLVSTATMVFTAVAVHQLEEENKLSLSDNLSIYFDTDKYTYLDAVTIENLLDTSVSLGSYTAEIDKDSAVKEEIIKKINSKKKNSGKKIREILEDYILSKGIVASKTSSSNYYILGRIIEKASGMGYDEYLQKNIFDKLGLKNTGFVSLDQKASGYDLATRTWVKQKDTELICSYDYLYSNSGVISTLDDMTVFFKAVLDKQLCKTDIVKKALRKSQGFSYGFSTDGTTLYLRGGYTLHRVYVCINPETEEIVTVLACTIGGSDLSTFGKKIYKKVNSKVNGIILEFSK